MRVFCLDAVHSIELGLLFGGAAFVSVAVTAATRAGGAAAAAVVKRMCVAHAYPDININILRKRTPTCVQYKPGQYVTTNADARDDLQICLQCVPDVTGACEIIVNNGFTG